MDDENTAARAVRSHADGSRVYRLRWWPMAVLSVSLLLLFMRALGDRFGRKRFLQLGLLLFAGASVFAAYAGSASQLIVARALMGLGGAMIMPSTLLALIDIFPRQERRIAAAVLTRLLERAP